MTDTADKIHPSLFQTCLLAGLLFLAASAQGHADQVVVDIRTDASLFYEQLAPYGQWLPTPEYGTAWKPAEVPPGWRPYTVGEWSYTAEQGWLWTSYWPWGWATFHYGRWANHADHGWIWIPGTEWAPAWVAWRAGDGMIGWAPLPPETGWHTDKGLAPEHRALEEKLPFYAWSFVPQAQIFSKELHTKEIVMSARNVGILPRTQNITEYRATDRRVINLGPNIERLAKEAGIRVHPTAMIDVTFPAGIKATKLEEGQVAVFRPTLSPGSKIPPLTPSITMDPKLSTKQIKRQQELTRNALETYHQSEAALLERLHQKELEQQATAQTLASVRTRHAAETRALDELQRWERHTLELQQRQTARAYGIDEALEPPAPGRETSPQR